MKLELRHNRIGDTAWDIFRNFDNYTDIEFNFSIFNNIFKALFRETVYGVLGKSVCDANKIAEREIKRLKEKLGYHSVKDKDIYVDYVLMFIDNYISNKEFREELHDCIEYVYADRDIATDYVMDEYVPFKSGFNICSGAISYSDKYSRGEAVMLTLLRVMFNYLYICKWTVYENVKLSNLRMSGVLNDLFIFKKKGYFWQTTGERVNGLDSKLKIPDVSKVVPKPVYSISDKEYGVLFGAEPVSIKTLSTVLKICIFRDISDIAYYWLIEDATYNDNVDYRADYDLGILEVLDETIEDVLVNSQFESLPMFDSLVIQT